MEFDFGFFAENAHITQEGKLFVFSGGISVLSTTQLPGIASLTLVAHMLVDPEEAEKSHTFKLDLSIPDATRLPLCEKQPLRTVRNTAIPDAQSGASLAVIMQIAMPLEGKYLVHLDVDGREVRAFPLWLKYVPVVKGE